MALSHVSLTGKPAAAWQYFTRASTLGRSYALNSCRVDLVAVLGMLGRFSLSGFRAIHHSLGPVVSRQPDMLGCCWALYTTTASLVKNYLAIRITDLSNTEKGMLERWHYMTLCWQVGWKGGEI